MSRRLLATVIGLVMAATASLSLVAPTATASTVSLDQFVVNHPAGSRVDTDGVPAGQPYQCVDLIKAYAHEVFGINPGAWGNAVEYQYGGTGGNALRANGFAWATDTNFQDGDILVWGDGTSTGPEGHVAIWYHGHLYQQNAPAGAPISTSGNFFASAYLGHWRPATGPNPAADSDHDGVIDPYDICPTFPGRTDPYGCPEDGASSGMSDFNGDGIADTFAAYQYPGQNPSIKIQIFSGRRSGTITGPTVWWQTDGSWDGSHARFVSGDFNGDGLADVAGIYEYPGETPSIKIHLFAGHRSGTITGPTVWWQTDGSWNGNLARFVTGDFNGDGISDLAGIYQYPGQTPSIKIHLFAGHRSGITAPDVIWQTDGSWVGSQARFVSGDFNGDGLTDVAGIYQYPGQNPSIKIHLFAGHRSGVTGPNVWWETDGSWNPSQARFVSGDFNGDGIADVAAAYQYAGQNPSIRIQTFWGRRSGSITGPNEFWQTDGSWSTSQARFMAGDFNGDGLADVAAAYQYPGQNPSIKIHLFAGHYSGITGPDVFWQTDGSWNSALASFGGGATQAIQMTTRPAITGTPRVGARLTASPGSWTPASGFSYQWLADGATISGATAATYVPSPGVIGKQISVRVTASRALYRPAASTSPRTSSVAPGVISNSVAPSITGTTRVGYTLTANPGTWSPTGLTYRYQWFRGTTLIKGATARTFKPGTAARGKRIRVRVIAVRAGYTSLAKFSAYTVAIR